MSIYSYTKENFNGDQLIQEIQNSDITIAFDYFSALGSALDIYFKANLSEGEETILDGIVSNHVPQIPITIPETVQRRYFSENTTQTISCNPSTWTTFYTKDFSNAVEFLEITINSENDHYLKIEVSNDNSYFVPIFSDKISNYIGRKTIVPSLFIILNGTTMKFDLSGNVYRILKISQKRRDTSTANLTISGYQLVYGEF